MLTFGCSDKEEPPLDSNLEKEVLNLREASCQPMGDDCVELFADYTIMSQFNQLGCGQCAISITMKITRCTTEGQPPNYFFEEVGVSPNMPCCTMDNQSLDTYYNSLISFYMDVELGEALPSCNDGANGSGTLPVSSFIKSDCVSYCTAQNSGNPPFQFAILCSQNGGCCIETKQWCRDDGGNAIPITGGTTRVPGVCAPLGFDPGDGILCRPCGSRCE